MSLKIEGLQIGDENTIFVRDFVVNPKPEKFGEEDALRLITCPGLIEAARRARAESYEDRYCQRCHKASVKWMPILRTYQVSGKCPEL